MPNDAKPDGTISFPCRCGKRIRVPEDQAGKTKRCPRCGQGVVVPPRSALAPPRPLVAKPVGEESDAPDSRDTAPPLSVQGPAAAPAPLGEPPIAHAASPAPLVPASEPGPIEAHPVSAPPPAAKPQRPPRSEAQSSLERLVQAAAAPHRGAAPAAHQAPLPERPPPPVHPPRGHRAPARPEPRPHKTEGSSRPQIILGAVVLLTIGAPWFILARPGSLRGLVRSSDSRLVMSWDLLSDAPAGIGAFLVAAWIVALAGVVVGIAVRGLPRSAVNAGLGLLGLIFFLAAGVDAMAPYRWAGHAPSVLVTTVLAFLPWLLVTAHCRLRLGQSLYTRVLLGFTGGMVAAFTLTLLVFLLIHFFDLSSSARREFILDLAVLVVALMVVMGGSIMLAVDGGSPRLRPQRCAGGLGVLYTGLALAALYLAVRPNLTALTGSAGNYALLPAFLLLMLALFGALLCGGGVTAACRGVELYRARIRPPSGEGDGGRR